jgi:hypothetical protein
MLISAIDGVNRHELTEGLHIGSFGYDSKLNALKVFKMNRSSLMIFHCLRNIDLLKVSISDLIYIGEYVIL